MNGWRRSYFYFLGLALVATLAALTGRATPIVAEITYKFPWQGGEANAKFWTSGPHSPYQAGLYCPDPPAIPMSQGSGLDFAGRGADAAFEVLAMAGGIVRQAGWLQQLDGEVEAWGYGVEIDHLNGYQTMYAHMDADLSLQHGQRVEQGHPLGRASNSGGPWPVHLHVELRSGGKMVGGVWQRGLPASWDGQVIDGWTLRAWQVKGDPTKVWNYEGTMVKGAAQMIDENPCGGDASFPGSKAVATDGVSWKQADSGTLPSDRNRLVSTNNRLFPFRHAPLPNLR